MAKNTNLTDAKKAKNDEFYTRIEDIEKELKYYKDFFRGKVVFCNCGDAIHHNFGKYFSMNFEHLGLKKLICTSFEMDGSHGKVAIYEGDKNGNYIPDSDEWTTYKLEGNGDFRSAECVELLKQSDVVVSNPPFSLFREYVAQLMEYGKKFLIIGNKNAITYKEIFPLIKDNKLWLGISAPTAYSTPLKEVENEKTQYKENGVVYQKFGNHGWFTNIEHSKRTYPLDLYKRYDAEKYPKYDNYNAINVNKTSDIPMDYNGVMGVSITFLDKYCPTQFEIVGLDRYVEGNTMPNKRMHINGKEIYARILIRRKYPKYDNYDAINVDKVTDIPCDYNGVMGVPITFLDKYCPTQFEIVGLMSGGKGENLTNGNDGRAKFYVNGKGVYARILIRRK